MPVYPFTYHAYLSWLPDRPQGYVRRDDGLLPRDLEMSDVYSRNAKHDGVSFDESRQRALVEEAMVAARHQRFRLHGAGTDPPHVHLLVSWRTDRTWRPLRESIKSSLSRRLNALRRASGEEGPSLSRGASRKPVVERAHFDHLMSEYLPDHPGWQWYEDRGWVKGKGCA